MNEPNEKELRCKVRKDTTYGKKVLRCVELLKDRTGLPVVNLIQEALIFYEQATRENEIIPEDTTAKWSEDQEIYAEGNIKQQGSLSSDLLRLSAGDETGC